MAIAVKLDRILVEKGITLTELAARVDLTLVNLSVLKTGRARAIRFSTLDALCDALDCQPGDLLHHIPRTPVVVPVVEPEPDATGSA